MLIRITKDCRWSFSPSRPVETFKKDEVYDFSNDKAEKMIKGNCAKSTIEAKEETEAKALPAGENKMLDPEKQENKSVVDKKGKKKGK